MSITKLAFVGHPTTDLEGARRFYGELLGLELAADYGQWVEYHTPDGKTVALDTISPQFGGSTPYLALECDDIVADVERLKAAGATVAKDVWTNDDPDGNEICKMAIVVDPSGNGVMLHQIAESRKG